LDTNVLVSAVMFGGLPERLLHLVRSGAVGGVTSLHILGEFQEVLVRPRFGIERGLAESLAVEVAAFMKVVSVAGGADIVVTGDHHLLDAQVPGLRILTVAQMLNELEPAPHRG
jgi:predicted nucleic acid-binding protein